MRAKLLTDDFDLTPECEQALGEIFDRYDKDGDGALNEAELQAFACYTNGAKFSSSELADIRTNLACTDSGALLKAGFLQLYHLQTSVDDDEDDNNDETWRDLQKHGYDDNLRLVQDRAPATGA